MTGSFGMLASTLPVQWLLPVVGWRPLFWGLAALLALSMLVLALVCPAGPPAPPAGKAQGSYRAVWRHPYFWQMAPIGFFSYGGMIAVQTLWAGPWMVRVAASDPLAAAAGLFTINISMLVTFWAWGMVTPAAATRPGRRPADRLGPAAEFRRTGRADRGAAPAPDPGAALFCASTFVALAQPAVGMAFRRRWPAGRCRPTTW